MTATSPALMSSGDLVADRRFGFAQDLAERGDFAAAADLLMQTVAIAPTFAAAWFALGETQLRLGDRAGAVGAFERTRALDAEDRFGAGLKLAQLGGLRDAEPMSPGYVRTLFDQYAIGFDQSLTKLGYIGPVLLARAVDHACGRFGRPFRFARALDLGCGTGLSGSPFRHSVTHLVGVDLSPNMIAQARAKHLYDRLVVSDILDFLAIEAGVTDRYDLVLAADVFVYLRELRPVLAAVAGVLASGGLAAFSVETHPGETIALGEKLRYAHAERYLRDALASAGLSIVSIANASTRMEAGTPVPGLIVVARRAAEVSTSDRLDASSRR